MITLPYFSFLITVMHTWWLLSFVTALLCFYFSVTERLGTDTHARAVRRRRRPNVGVAQAPFSWRVHVMLYTSYMLLAFCNVVYNEAWTLAKRTMRACFAIALDAQTKHGGVKAKVFSGTVFWKWNDAKSFVWNFFGNWVNKEDGTVKDFNSVYCNNCL